MGRSPGNGGSVDDGVDPAVVPVAPAVGVGGAVVVGAGAAVDPDGVGPAGVLDAGDAARADDDAARSAVMVTMMPATGMIATSAMRVRMAPPFVGRAKAPSSARCWRAPASAFGPRTASGKASFVLASRRRVCGRFGYAQACVVVTPLISSLSRVGGSACDGRSGHENARAESGTRPLLAATGFIGYFRRSVGPVSDYRARPEPVRWWSMPRTINGADSTHPSALNGQEIPGGIEEIVAIGTADTGPISRRLRWCRRAGRRS